MSDLGVIPVQIAHCACVPDDWRPCNGEFYECTGCGERGEEPFPYAEPMESPALDLTEASSWFYYCRACAFAWILDGADVRRVPTPTVTWPVYSAQTGEIVGTTEIPASVDADVHAQVDAVQAKYGPG